MRAHRLKYLWLTLGCLMIVATYIVCLYPFESDGPGLFPHADKLIHLWIYLWLVLWFGELFESRHHWVLLPAFFTMGLSIECLQTYSETRHFEWLDMLANGLGILLALSLLRSRVDLMIYRLERILGSR